MATERQADAAIRLYTTRASQYDKSWHPLFTKRFVSYLSLSPGQKVLDLACGTGLLTFLEADLVGPSGQVVGVDVTPGMLSEAMVKKQKAGKKYPHVAFYQGDILDLEVIPAIKGETFDVITLASALVLFPDPESAVRYWTGYLKPGGVIAMDSTHPNNLVVGMVLERTGKRLGLPIPYHRDWSRSETSLQEVLESAGLEVVRLTTVNNQAGYGRRTYKLTEADALFRKHFLVGESARALQDRNILKKAKGIFREEWDRLAVNGKVEEIDAVFLAVGRKRTCA